MRFLPHRRAIADAHRRARRNTARPVASTLPDLTRPPVKVGGVDGAGRGPHVTGTRGSARATDGPSSPTAAPNRPHPTNSEPPPCTDGGPH